MKTEKRFLEFRFEPSEKGGSITGTAIRYGDRAKIGDFSESFAPGSLKYDDVLVNLQHDRSKPVARIGAGLTLRDSADRLEVRIDLPETVYAREARELIDARIIRGMSIEFHAAQAKWDGQHRTVTDARLFGIGLVDRPAYSESQIAARFQELHGSAPQKRRKLL